MKSKRMRTKKKARKTEQGILPKEEVSDDLSTLWFQDQARHQKVLVRAGVLRGTTFGLTAPRQLHVPVLRESLLVPVEEFVQHQPNKVSRLGLRRHQAAGMTVRR